MKKLFFASLGMMTALFALPVVVPVTAQTQKATLAALSPGQWSIRTRGGTELRRLCVKSGRELVRIRHVQARCTSRVLRDDGKSVTVRYSCPGSGHGESTITRETDRLVQIRSQGIDDGSPFDLNLEARRIGTC